MAILIELAGVGVISVALWLIWPPLALIAAGAFLLLTAQAIGRDDR